MGRITSQKRQKERKRKEKQEMKAQRRAEKKFAKAEASKQPGGSSESVELPPEPNAVRTF